MKRLVLFLGSALLIVAAGAVTVVIIKYAGEQSQASRQPAAKTPELTAVKLAEGLDHPWDIDFLPDKTLIFTERSGTLSVLVNGETKILEDISDVQAIGEGGLMGLAVDPDFSRNRFIYACLSSSHGDVRVARWTVTGGLESLAGRTDIVTGLPAAETGRHAGCQLAFGPDKNLWIGTGDAGDETQPQDSKKLGGKILRVARDGSAASDNPPGPDRRVYSYGHRNVQAIVFYPRQRERSYGLSVEHGPDRDDEVNELKPGNFGWAPGAGYDESVPMTDMEKYPDAIASVWNSGTPTIAPSGAAFLSGAVWGRFDGWLAVSVLKGERLLLLNVSNGTLSGVRTFFEKDYGRLRAATLGPDEALYVSTDNGTNDALLKITPAKARR